MKIISRILLALTILFLLSCHKDSSLNLLIKSPKCSIVSQSALYKDKWKFTCIDFVIKNNGKGPTAYNVSLFIKLKKGGSIVSQNRLDFEYLVQGETASAKAQFPIFDENLQYDYVDTHLYWYDADGNYHE